MNSHIAEWELTRLITITICYNSSQSFAI